MALINSDKIELEGNDMKILFIGGTGTISKAIVEKLSVDGDWQVYLLNRGNRQVGFPGKVTQIVADINDESDVENKLKDIKFDVVCDFIGFTLEHVKRDYRLFKDKTNQYIYISSASAYQKPVENYIITENTKLENPFWQYSRDKKACEEYLLDLYKNEGFPVTIVRPSHTYDERSIPVGVHGSNGSWQVIKRMKQGKPVIIHGDGTSLWTLTFNTDFATGFIGLLGNSKTIGEVYHITGDEVLTWNQIYETIAETLGVKLNAYYISSSLLSQVGKKYDFTGALIGDKANSVVFDNAKVKDFSSDLKTTVSFKQGCKIALDYIENHPEECQKDDEEFDKWCDKVIDAIEKAKESLINE